MRSAGHVMSGWKRMTMRLCNRRRLWLRRRNVKKRSNCAARSVRPRVWAPSPAPRNLGWTFRSFEGGVCGFTACLPNHWWSSRIIAMMWASKTNHAWGTGQVNARIEPMNLSGFEAEEEEKWDGERWAGTLPNGQGQETRNFVGGKLINTWPDQSLGFRAYFFLCKDCFLLWTPLFQAWIHDLNLRCFFDAAVVTPDAQVPRIHFYWGRVGMNYDSKNMFYMLYWIGNSASLDKSDKKD